MGAADVAILGGGIIGCSAAALLAERGASVVLVEATAIGAGASGRNMGAIQHPFDALLTKGRQPPNVRTADTDCRGAQGKRFEHIGASPKSTVY